MGEVMDCVNCGHALAEHADPSGWPCRSKLLTDALGDVWRACKCEGYRRCGKDVEQRQDANYWKERYRFDAEPELREEIERQRLLLEEAYNKILAAHRWMNTSNRAELMLWVRKYEAIRAK